MQSKQKKLNDLLIPKLTKDQVGTFIELLTIGRCAIGLLLNLWGSDIIIVSEGDVSRQIYTWRT